MNENQLKRTVIVLLLSIIGVSTSFRVAAQDMADQVAPRTRDVLILKKYDSDKVRRINTGVHLRVHYPADWRAIEGWKKWWVMFAKSSSGKGMFHSIEGDSILLLRKGAFKKYPIRALTRIKVRTGLGARFFGGLFAGTGAAIMGYGGGITIFGMVQYFANEPWWFIYPMVGLPILGIGALVFKLGQLVLDARNYNLIRKWYIQGSL